MHKFFRKFLVRLLSVQIFGHLYKLYFYFKYLTYNLFLNFLKNIF